MSFVSISQSLPLSCDVHELSSKFYFTFLCRRNKVLALAFHLPFSRITYHILRYIDVYLYVFGMKSTLHDLDSFSLDPRGLRRHVNKTEYNPNNFRCRGDQAKPPGSPQAASIVEVNVNERVAFLWLKLCPLGLLCCACFSWTLISDTTSRRSPPNGQTQ